MTTFRSTKEDVNIVDASHHHVTDNLDVDTVKDAAQADAIEHKQTLAQAFAVHKKAIFWSMALSAALIMEGYDVVVIGSFYGQRELFACLRQVYKPS
jgi:SP family general alpha glucoside:H+ symporter-like MFS transporter